MKTFLAVATVALSILAPLAAQSQTKPSRTWVPATYRGLVVGKSTRNDVLRVLGKPTSAGKVADTSTPYTSYEVTDPFPGTLMVIVRHGILSEMDLYPKAPLTRAKAIAKLGPGYKVVRYSIDDCLGEGGVAPVYEDPDGEFEQIEYRHRGIALALQGAEVQTVMFVAKPFGPTHSRCAGRKTK